jgi:Rap1a immunity proteins
MPRSTKTACVLALLMLAAGASSGSASWRTGNQLYEECRKATPLFAFGYIFGVLDGEEALGQLYERQRTFCLPANVTEQQVFDVVCRYLDTYPERRQDTAGWLATGALFEAWPCPQ